MFTGIIEDIGTVTSLNSSGNSMVLTVTSEKIVEDIHMGDSISVSGVCLTVTAFTNQTFTVDVMPETMKDTSLRLLKAGSLVNLERAMSANGRFGGHFVSGHIDGTGTIAKKERKENAVYYVIELSDSLSKYCIPKGSIAIDGTSLTIFGIQDNLVTVSLIPLTHQETVLGRKNAGDIVNVENDMIGKYIVHQIETKNPKKELTMEFLTDHGF
ncbi:riboflavin synthase [Peribacillus cavernae]|uniref:Riboflavin synthase n=1 Tax=Peribacillus cavernae TaxID=1674310 RepID=A0A433HJW0_9BACI|nr:riboflavin synthase [Peribacillus cavernae]MDQ0219085.1 riboflavin synthase [Peribacillus cavernae]RUQ28680.1 riboflavin synthase [Peribacillus cavernae]